ncbi:YbaK/EbsC family protein [Bacillus sp. DTU_2020_1000418_1_SI_GHA_SEK_038]|uniref:YbaK/EbsC family protein n=1 Tax=Bacillus sp. DTU_2020_1000418_1_SI_GHA_SEK_038 TaxID=3077585 RepID=UPI0028F15BFE|nr:YbaK/EbsC family protein [Bacillus sp. DTU_2020_1000418_1_SI_GHA_SEK_038]WNS75833.1 YbaK/EbsC family protein [Bacillus sp. DTU_2020_1000418_1_SI_GHA_SEK_038]
MSFESVKAHFKKWNRDEDIMEFDVSSATVDLAAEAIGVIPARIAKTLSFRGEGDHAILIVAAGDAKIDNKKFRQSFGFKARMLSAEEVVEQTGHVIGGVCPFGLANDLDVYLDVSMKRFETLFPACGSTNSAIELTCDEIFEYAAAKEWVDVCKGWEEEQEREAVTALTNQTGN